MANKFVSKITSATLSVKVIPGVRFESFDKLDDVWVIRIREKAVDGMANDALCKRISNVLNVPLSRITVVKGAKSRQKVLRVESVDDTYVNGCFELEAQSNQQK